ncbi:ferredoxin [Amycolatopsis rubida]|uniref:Ferredoxin n=1 Tax=Amycolatopsis rubida TaxID=112413 RepID=A0A1I5HQ40_9PSEU|nr:MULTISPECIES: ferredoxin [Amycolatopsis]MYW90847.1 ferredoxin [Amycolatopsis rubida]NEC55830.1 ferredoxin [Amycolatopsis rubida]OAP26092.1 Ferredoxin-2 [Amycolatopsis sp. M39]SFO50428.1 Ferredoxin [Amycolatopsis rubida]
MKIAIEEDKCCGAGPCVLIAPEVFDQREDDGIVFLLEQAPGADLHEQVVEAAEVCPAACIRLDHTT